MEEAVKMENHLSSAAAFVEGGIQNACDDSCSICLEDFCNNDPSTVRNLIVFLGLMFGFLVIFFTMPYMQC